MIRPPPTNEIETIDIFEEVLTQHTQLNHISQTPELHIGNNIMEDIQFAPQSSSSGPLTAAVSPNFNFRTEGQTQERENEINILETTPPRLVSTGSRTPITPLTKRNLFAISPVKQVSRKRTNEGPIKTLVFCDFETSGLYPQSTSDLRKNLNLKKSTCPSDFATELERFIMGTQKDKNPRVLELSFVAVRRETFERSIKKMECLRQQSAWSLKVRVPCNIHTRQINPNMTPEEWLQYENYRSQNPLALVRDKNDLNLFNNFEVEWKQVREFLESCPKPACLVAHNGLYFDFRILYNELARYNLLESHPLPKGIFFVDSLLAIQHIDDLLKNRLSQTLHGIDWTLVSRLTLSDDVVVEQAGIPADHPLKFLNKSELPTVVFTRFTPSDFKKTPSGQWEFIPSVKSNKLERLYESIITGVCDFHNAEDDSLALLQVCLAYGKEFLEYMDKAAAEMPF